MSNFSKTGVNNGTFIRCGIYVVSAIIAIITYKVIARKKTCMLILAVSFIITYAIMVFGNGVVAMVLVFPVLIGFMIYLNSVLVGFGCIAAFIIGAIKCYIVKSNGNIEWFNYGNLITIGFVVAIYGSYRAIELLINARVTPLLMREILFGRHDGGFTATVALSGNDYILTV